MDSSFLNAPRFRPPQSLDVQSSSSGPPHSSHSSHTIVAGSRSPGLHFHTDATSIFQHAHAHHPHDALLSSSSAPIDVVNPNEVFSPPNLSALSPYSTLHIIHAQESSALVATAASPNIKHGFVQGTNRQVEEQASKRRHRDRLQSAVSIPQAAGSSAAPDQDTRRARSGGFVPVDADDIDGEERETAGFLANFSTERGSGGQAGCDSHLLEQKFVQNPPNLAAWRRKLFDLQEMVVLSNDEYDTYFPHVDNVYSHRSTQRYKRKPFVSHYYDCRLKGRPSGTPKSDDPSKKKRKRSVRERDLCDVKIKVTEYAPGAPVASVPELRQHPELQQRPQKYDDGPPNGAKSPSGNLGDTLSEVLQHRFWTIQRVSGNGQNGAGTNGIPAMHKHSLERSDDVKKSSVQRWLAAIEKGTKKSARCPSWKATGGALTTVKRHSKEAELKFYAACFCSFSQRVWIALEAKGLPYQYCETDPFRKPKPKTLLEANPRGLVPAIRQGEWACGESAVILEYLEEMDGTLPLFPTDPRLKAICRLWIDFIASKIVPGFYALLTAAERAANDETVKQLQGHLTSLVHAASEEGPYFLGDKMCLVDVHFAPFALRLSRLAPIRQLRDWAPQQSEARWRQWLGAFGANAHVRNTTSSDPLYQMTADLLARVCQSQLD